MQQPVIAPVSLRSFRH